MRWLRWLRDAWSIVGITLLLVLIIDALLEKWLESNSETVVAGAAAPDHRDAPGYRDQAWVDVYWSEHRQSKAMDWRSYVYWRRQPFAGERINIDDQGLRSTWTPDVDPIAEIWVMGGSAVWGTGVGDDGTVPSLLAQVLADRGQPVRVVNFGESGYVSGQSLITLIEALAVRSSPDIVVFLEGANDVFAALQEGRAGTPQNEANRRAEFRASTGFDNWLAMFPNLLEGVAALATPSMQIEPPALADDVVARYLHNLSVARSLARDRGFQVLAYWQPTVFARANPSAHETEVVAASLKRHRDLQRAADALIGADSTVVNLGPTLDEVHDNAFLDFVHLGPTGNQLIGEVMARDLAPYLDVR